MGGAPTVAVTTAAAPTIEAAPATTDAAPATTDAAPSTTDAAPTSAAATSAAAASAGGYTSAGSALKLGQMAIVDVPLNKKPVAVGLTLVKVTKGTAADLATLDIGGNAATMTPWYLTYTITNIHGAKLTDATLDSPDGIIADGSKAQPVSPSRPSSRVTR